MTDLTDLTRSVQQLAAVAEGIHCQLSRIAVVLEAPRAPQMQNEALTDLLSTLAITLEDLMEAETRQADEIAALRECRQSRQYPGLSATFGEDGEEVEE